MADQGYGQQDPSDTSSGFNADAFMIEQMLNQISTAKLVKVMAVDTTAKTVDVQPMVNQLDGQNNSTPHGTINAIPYLYTQAGTNAVMMDPVVGDMGLMACCDRDISSALNAKAVANPGSLRKYDNSDGIYLFGLPGINAAPTQWVKFTNTGVQIADKNSNTLTSSSAGWEFKGPVKFDNAATFSQTVDVKGTASLEGNLQLTGAFQGASGGVYGNIVISGTITCGDAIISGRSFNSHFHDYIVPAGPYQAGPAGTTSPV